MRHLLDIASLSDADLQGLVARALELKRGAAARRFEGMVGLVFFEASTRTRTSFGLAASELGARVLDLSMADSSVTKGETEIDTLKTLHALGARVFVVRARESGLPLRLSAAVEAGIVNAGDGWHAHPTQALVDVTTVVEAAGRVQGKRIAILGDLLHSRVARSSAEAFRRLGADVRLAGPPLLAPRELGEALSLPVYWDAQEAVAGADIVMALRMQRERMADGLVPSLAGYREAYGLSERLLERAAPGALVMHPGPINRGVEIESAVADGPRSLILRQVENGRYVRMAVLERLGEAWQCVS